MRRALVVAVAACAQPVPAPKPISNEVPTPVVAIDELALGTPSTPGAMRARLIKVDDIDRGTLVTIAVGSEQGVNRTGRFSLVNYPGADLVVIRVNQRTTIAKIELPRDVVLAHPIVEIVPAE